MLLADPYKTYNALNALQGGAQGERIESSRGINNVLDTGSGPA